MRPRLARPASYRPCPMLNAGQLGKRQLTFAAIKLALTIATFMMLAVGTW